MKYFLFSFFVCLILTGEVYAEGSKQLLTQPSDSAKCVIVLSKGFSSGGNYGVFASTGAPEDKRIWFRVTSSTEKVYFGFKQVSGFGSATLTYNIKTNLGVIKKTGTVPTSSGAGYITSYTRATTGPTPVFTGGYNSLLFNPTTAGDYYMEFEWSGTGDQMLQYFDITVTTSTNQVKDGRVYSKDWFFSTEGSSSNTFKGTLYPYTDDHIVTAIDFNGLAPYYFRVACNPTGCTSTGVFENDRRSQNGLLYYAQYPIFFNNPDPNVYPTGILGEVTNVSINNDCDGILQVNVNVTKDGYVDILMDINPLPGYQAEDIKVSDSVYASVTNTLTWNGLNGLGQQVPNGTSVNIVVSYINGLTNLPMYDVEYNSGSWQGFKVNLIRPTGVKPKVYWVDTLLYPTGGWPATALELNGCTNVGGCHYWGSIGNEKTINTWWYSLSTTLLPIALTYKHSHFFESSQSICNGDSALVFGIYRKVNGIYWDSAYNIMGCDSVHKFNLIVNGVPPGVLGADTGICTGTVLILDGGFWPGATYLWNTGATTQTIPASTSGPYSVLVTTPQGCNRFDSMNLMVSDPPPPILIKHN